MIGRKSRKTKASRRRKIKAAPRFPLKTLADVWNMLSSSDRKRLLKKAVRTTETCDDLKKWTVAEATGDLLEKKFARAFEQKIVQEVVSIVKSISSSIENDIAEGYEPPSSDIVEEWFFDELQDSYGDVTDFPVEYKIDIPEQALARDLETLLFRLWRKIGRQRSMRSLTDLLTRMVCNLYGQGAISITDAVVDTLQYLYEEALGAAEQELYDEFDFGVDLTELYHDSLKDLSANDEKIFEAVVDQLAGKAAKVLDDLLGSTVNVRLPHLISTEDELKAFVWGK